jgi:uncharacterized OB-fold protein
MTDNTESKLTLIEEFKGLTTKQWLAIAGGFVAAGVLTAMNLALSCIGFLVIAVLLYMIPHMTGVASPKIKAVIGVVFIVVMMLIGTFAYMGAPTVDYKLYGSGSDIDNISYDFETGVITIESSKSNLDLKVESATIVMISYGSALQSSECYDDAAVTYSAGKYTATPKLVPNDYDVIFVGISTDGGESYDQIYRIQFDNGVSSGDMMYKNFMGAGYVLLLVGLMYFVMLIFSELMRRSARKSREKMEAEGRLYPEGYSKCKECGTMVLPGEITCRKCGAPIEVPEEIKVLHKKDYFKCSECGTEVPNDAKVCPKCGAKFDEEEETEIKHADGTVDVSSETFECSECGKKVPANAKKCPYCGADFDEEDE